jgi:hypothetical protein
MGTTGSAQGGARERFVVTEAERRVADLLSIEVDLVLARATLHAVPFWFHTFALNRAEGIFTPGAARPSLPRLRATRGLRRDERARCRLLRRRLRSRRAPGRAEAVVAVDNEQYRLWVPSRWGVELQGGEGFRAVHRLLGSAVEYRRMDGFALDGLEERFDFVCCFGILHRVENSLGLLRVLRGRTVGGGAVLVETYGVGRKIETARRSASPSPGRSTRATSSSAGGSGTPACSGLPGLSVLARRVARRCGGRRRPAHHRSAGRVEAPGRRSQQPLHQTTVSGRYCRSGFVELSGSSSAPIRARSDWRFGAARLLSC